VLEQMARGKEVIGSKILPLLRIGETTPPNEQRWVMRSAGLPGLVGAGSASEHGA